MTNIPLPILVAVFFFLGGALILEVHHRYQEKMRGLPLREAFMARYAQLVPACSTCGGERLDEKGLSHGEDTNRVVSCSHCNALLFRFVDASRPSEDADWAEP